MAEEKASNDHFKTKKDEDLYNTFIEWYYYENPLSVHDEDIRNIAYDLSFFKEEMTNWELFKLCMTDKRVNDHINQLYIKNFLAYPGL